MILNELEELEESIKKLEELARKISEEVENQALSEWNEQELEKCFLIIENSEKARNQTLSELKQGHRKKMFTEIQVAEIKRLYSAGVSKNKIAKIFHCSEKTIRNYLKREA